MRSLSIFNYWVCDVLLGNIAGINFIDLISCGPGNAHAVVDHEIGQHFSVDQDDLTVDSAREIW